MQRKKFFQSKSEYLTDTYARNNRETNRWEPGRRIGLQPEFNPRMIARAVVSKRCGLTPKTVSLPLKGSSSCWSCDLPHWWSLLFAQRCIPRSVRTATVSGLFSIRKRHKNGILAAVKRSRFGRQRSVKFRFTAYSFSDRKLPVPQTVWIGPFTAILQLNYNLSPRLAIYDLTIHTLSSRTHPTLRPPTVAPAHTTTHPPIPAPPTTELTHPHRRWVESKGKREWSLFARRLTRLLHCLTKPNELWAYLWKIVLFISTLSFVLFLSHSEYPNHSLLAVFGTPFFFVLWTSQRGMIVAYPQWSTWTSQSIKTSTIALLLRSSRIMLDTLQVTCGMLEIV